MKKVAELQITPRTAQIDVSDLFADDYPQWSGMGEPVTAIDRSIAVSTRPENEGMVVVQVVSVAVEDALTAPGVCVYDGPLLITNGELVIGNVLAQERYSFPTANGRRHVRIFVDPPARASLVTVALTKAKP